MQVNIGLHESSYFRYNSRPTYPKNIKGDL